MLIDTYMKKFSDDCLDSLRVYDQKIYKNLKSGKYLEFYSNDWKGIGLYSITEPIIKYLIFTSLIGKYKMWSEWKDYYSEKNSSNKYLDLALHFGRKVETDKEGYIIPNVAVEMKWTSLTKQGDIYKNWLPTIKADFEKLQRCNPTYKDINKYLMQFVILKSDLYEDKTLQKRIANNSDTFKNMVHHGTFKNPAFKLVYNDGFDTFGATENDRYKFVILVWKVW